MAEDGGCGNDWGQGCPGSAAQKGGAVQEVNEVDWQPLAMGKGKGKGKVELPALGKGKGNGKVEEDALGKGKGKDGGKCRYINGRPVYGQNAVQPGYGPGQLAGGLNAQQRRIQLRAQVFALYHYTHC